MITMNDPRIELSELAALDRYTVTRAHASEGNGLRGVLVIDFGDVLWVGRVARCSGVLDGFGERCGLGGLVMRALFSTDAF